MRFHLPVILLMLAVCQPASGTTLLIKTIEGKEYSLDIPVTSTITEVKSAVQKATGTSSERQRLIHAGRELKDASKLSDYNITDKATLYLVVARSSSLDTPSVHVRIDNDTSLCELGKNATYTITIRNEQTAALTNVIVTFEVPMEMRIAGITSTNARLASVSFAPIKLLEPAQIAEFKVTCTATTTGEAVARSSVTWPGATKPVTTEGRTTIFK